jgi:hypothetical protein
MRCLAKLRVCILIKNDSFFREFKELPPFPEEGCFKVLLQGFDLHGHGRLGHKESLCRLGEIFLPGRIVENSKVIEIDLHIGSINETYRYIKLIVLTSQ